MIFPLYSVSDTILDKIYTVVENVMKENIIANRDEYTYRFFRPEELSDALTSSTRKYDTTKTGTGYERILGATKDIVVPTGHIYLIMGLYVQNDPTAPFGLSAVCRIKVNGVQRAEWAPAAINTLENQLYVDFNQIIVAKENTKITIEVNSPDNANARAIIYPFGFNIGPKSELDVT